MNGKTLFTKEFLFNCIVEINNTREDRRHHMNILQEECCQFGRLIGSIAAQINHDNPGLPEQIHTEETSIREAYILGILALL